MKNPFLHSTLLIFHVLQFRQI